LDVASIATAVAGFLVPFLPYLRTAGEKMAEGALKKFGEDGYNRAKSAWARLGSKLGSQPGAAESLAELERNPGDIVALETLARQIESLLKADAKLAQEMSVLIGGDVINSTIVVGEKNVVGRVDTGGGDFVLGDRVVTNIQAPVASVSALHQLPPPPADFTGRVEELAELLGKIKQGGVAISGVRGMGGIGKTALALVLADRLKADYTDAQLYLDLKGTSEKPLTVREILERVILSFHPDSNLPEGEAQLANIYRSVLDGRRAILLMDNAAGSGQVAPLVPPSGSILLITSRNRFNVPGLFQLDIGGLPEEDARDLLLKIAPRIGEQAGQIAELCGFLPLALRGAANLLAVTPGLRVDEYVRMLKDERTRLEAIGSTDIPIGVEASIGLSYGLLAGEAQQVFRWLAVFPGSFDKGAEQKICEDAGSKHLMELEQRSLVTYDERADRYKLHDLVRLFADGRLPEDERQAAQRRHAAHYKDVLGAAKSLYRQGGASVGAALGLFDSEWANIGAGQAWAEAHSAADEVAASLCADYPDAGVHLLDLRQHPREIIRWREGALAAVRRLKNRRAEGAHLGHLGLAHFWLGEYRRAVSYHEQALVIFRENGDRRAEGQCMGNLGSAYYSLGDYHRAIDHHQQDLAIAREMGDRQGEGSALGNLGLACHWLADYRTAIEYQAQAITIFRELGDLHGEGQALANLGIGYQALGDDRRAIEGHEAALVIMREMGDRRGEGSVLGDLGVAYKSLGDYPHAINCYEQCRNLAREMGDRHGEGSALYNIAVALSELGDYANALASAEAALRIHEEIEDPWTPEVQKLVDRLRGLARPDAK
jgi:tetratricopeptide (TPR) repeat protein